MPSSKPRILDWDRAGRALRALDPDRFARVLALAEAYISAHVSDEDVFRERLLTAQTASMTRSDEIARARRAGFRLIEGGLSSVAARAEERRARQAEAMVPAGGAA